MRRSYIVIMLIALVASACTLSNSPASETILTEAPTTVALDSAPTRTPISTDEEADDEAEQLGSGSLDTVDTNTNNTNSNSGTGNTTTVNTNTNTNTSRDTQTVVCNKQTGWNTYTVVSGDTLFGIAQRANSTVDTLVSANCLVDEGLIEVGQILYVPNPVQPRTTTGNNTNNNNNNSNNNSGDANTPNNDPNRYTTEAWWIVQGDSANGFRVGCGDALLLQQTGVPSNLGTRETLTRVFQHLTDDNNIGVGQADRGWWNPISQTNLTVKEVSVAKNHSVVRLEGTIPRISACVDAQMEAQIAMNVLSLTRTQVATIFVNEQNMREFFDASGATNQTQYMLSEFQNGAGAVPGSLIEYWVGQDGFGSPATDVMVGCDTFITAIDGDHQVSGDVKQDIEIALQTLFDPNRWIPPVYTNLVKDQNLTVESVTVNGGHVDVRIGGQLLSGGVCANPIIEGQILQTIFQFNAVQSVKVMNGDMNLKRLTDESGLEDLTDYVYTRSQLP